ncbi:LOW QUALITY PROTEIN: hypothetical protein HJC23_012510, partial [Cyclotella cryptica]
MARERREVSVLLVPQRHSSFTHESTLRPSAMKRTHSFNEAVITGKETRRIYGRDQMCYLCHLPFLDNNAIYHVVWTNVSILTATQTPFALPLSALMMPLLNYKYVDSDTCAADIAHLIAAGVEVDVKQPAPENTVPDNTSPTQKWQLPTTCACKADDNIKVIARWKKFSWPTILSMDVLAIFRMSPMSLWWSKKDINQFEGDPFRLNNVMSLNRFQAIDKAMRYTNCPPPTDFVDRFHDIRCIQHPLHRELHSLVLKITKPIHGTGKIFSMDSGFCVSAGILALHDKGVYGQALNKKRWRYWPRGMPADDINIHFESKIVCEFDSYQQKS